jgi:iron(III) transport system ATP-binding protein
MTCVQTPATAEQPTAVSNGFPATEQIRVEGLGKSFSSAGPVVDGLSFSLNRGEILALLGPSGCGKTTTLRMIAGFEAPDCGQTFLHGRDVTRLPPQERKIGIVFQDYALFPHMTVLENIAFGMRSVPRRERADRAVYWISLLELEKLEQRYPHELSGGQQQRVALARTLAAEPDLVLLDEPFSSLDAALRNSTRKEMRRLFKERGVTAILVTHDQLEALSFADRIGMLSAGRLQQLDTPEKIYQNPENLFVAEFLGHTNLLEVELDGCQSQSPLGPLTTVTGGQGRCCVSLRPEHLELVSDPAGEGQVISREFRGHDCFYHVECQGREYKVLAAFDCRITLGERVSLRIIRPGVVLRD